MNRQTYILVNLLIGIIITCMPLSVFAQDVTIEITGNKAVILLPTISKGMLAEVPIDSEGGFPIQSLALGTAEKISDVKLTIEILDGKPIGFGDVNGTVYQYLSIMTENLDEKDLVSAKIQFRIPKIWLSDNGVEATTVGLLGIFEGEWSILPTQKLQETSEDVTFSSDLPNLHFINYAVSGKIPMVTTTTTMTTTLTTTTYIATTTVTSTPVVTATITTTVQGDNTMAYIAIGAAAVAIAVLLMIYRSSRSRPNK